MNTGMQEDKSVKRYKLLYILNLADKVNNFSYASMMAAKVMGIEFHIAGNWSYISEDKRLEDEKRYGIKIHQIDFVRIPYHLGNSIAYKQLKKLILRESYDVIHCNTPIGGVLGRILGKQCNVKKIIYQVHGFHFYKGAPKINWLIYYPIEKLLARYTDALITINQEDYALAKTKFKLRNGGQIYYVPGVGIDTTQYNTEETSRQKIRSELGLKDGDIAVISMGDLIARKNYDIAIRAIARSDNGGLHYFICGKGPEEENLRRLAEKLNVSSQIHFLGFRSDIKKLLTASDIFLFTTKQEGLPRSLMEAMASGLPCIVSKIRENTDLLDNSKGGYLCSVNDVDAYAEKLNLLFSDIELRKEMGRNNLLAIQKFSIGMVTDDIRTIYDAKCGGRETFDEYMYSLTGFFPIWARKRMELNIPLDAFVLISVGELNANKNNGVIISALEKLEHNDVHYVMCGRGELESLLRGQVDKVGLKNRVHFLGYRNDMKELYEMADCFVMPSFREGLSRSIMEAMASGLPCIVSKIRGNTDLVKENEGGFLCFPDDEYSFLSAIKQLYDDCNMREKMGSFNKEQVKRFDISNVEKALQSIYARR